MVETQPSTRGNAPCSPMPFAGGRLTSRASTSWTTSSASSRRHSRQMAATLLVSAGTSGASVAYGPESNRASELVAMAPAGTALASDALAVVLAASPAAALRSELYHLGDAETGGTVHMLLPKA